MAANSCSICDGAPDACRLTSASRVGVLSVLPPCRPDPITGDDIAGGKTVARELEKARDKSSRFGIPVHRAKTTDGGEETVPRYSIRICRNLVVF